MEEPLINDSALQAASPATSPKSDGMGIMRSLQATGPLKNATPSTGGATASRGQGQCTDLPMPGQVDEAVAADADDRCRMPCRLLPIHEQERGQALGRLRQVEREQAVPTRVLQGLICAATLQGTSRRR